MIIASILLVGLVGAFTIVNSGNDTSLTAHSTSPANHLPSSITLSDTGSKGGLTLLLQLV